MKKAILIPIIAILVAAAVLLGVSGGLSATKEAKAQAELSAKLLSLLPADTGLKSEEYIAWLSLPDAEKARDAALVQEEYTGEDANIQAVYKGNTGYVIATMTDGYAGELGMLIGVSNEGKVTGLQVREMRETAGLGMRTLNDVDFLKQFLNTEGGLTVGENIDALTSATVTSKAVTRSVNSAVAFVTGADISSSATTWGG